MKKNLFKVILGACAVVAMLGMTSCQGEGPIYLVVEYSPDRHVLIQEYVEEEGGHITSGRMSLYDVVLEEIIGIEEGEINEDEFCGYDVLSTDYERIISGNLTPEEKSALMGLVREIPEE